jgi:hypothetical protein
MDEVETRLRDGLIAVAEPVRPTVQAEALFAPGERLRRVRRSRAVAGGLALALVGWLGWTGLAPLRPNGSAPGVATPSPSVVATASPSPSVVDTEDPPPLAKDRARIELSSNAGVTARVEGSAVPSAGGLMVTLYRYSPSGALLQSWTGEATADRPFDVASDLGQHLRIGVLAHPAVDLWVPMNSDSDVTPGILYEPLPGVDATLYLAYDDDGSMPTIDRLEWESPSGEHFDGTGKRLSQVQVALGGLDGWLYLDQTHTVLRYKINDMRGSFRRGALVLDCDVPDPAMGPTKSLQVCLVPHGSTIIRTKLAPGVRHSQRYHLDGWDVIVAIGAPQSGNLVTSVTYRDDRGYTYTETPRPE